MDAGGTASAALKSRTRGVAFRWGCRVLARAGLDSARVEAEVLLGEALGGSRHLAYLDPQLPLSETEHDRFVALVRRRARRVPIQYVVGRETFCGLDLVVTPDVLIPRPETEGAVAAVLAAVADTARPVIADVGTGSGCVALALAAARPDALIYALDYSPAALDVARVNAERFGMGARVRFLEGDLVAPLLREGVQAHVVVSNPPYVADGEFEGLQPEVRCEPDAALRGGPDGLQYYRRIIAEAPGALASRGRVVLELGFGHAEAVQAMAARAGLGIERLDPDFNGIPRILTVIGPPWT